LAGETVPEVQSQPWVWVVVAGLLVGFGTRLGSGCTSGHGVCGLSRLSPRSLVATLMFMASGFLTVFVLRHLL
ncbi:YeeE/YedE family protein, partial [Alcaligenes pakistanensis]